MTTRLPAPARRLLEEGSLCYVAVRTPFGPHLTPVVYALDGGWLWVTTARRSVKARAWRTDPEVAGLVRSGDAAICFRGAVRTYDALDPFSWPATAVAGPRLLRAATRFSLKNARFFAGYAVDARRVPLAWTPPGRVFVGIRMWSARILQGGEVVGGWGEWPEGAGFRRSFVAPARNRSLDRAVPQEVRKLLEKSGNGALAIDGRDGLSVLPTTWRRMASDSTYEAMLPRRVLALARASSGAKAALTFDHASRWRAADMMGLLVVGTGHLHALTETSRGRRALRERLGARPEAVLVRVAPSRIVWWRGWTSGTVAAVVSGGRP